MTTQISWQGHGCWTIHAGEHRIILDPFLDDSPTSPTQSKDVDAEFILVSHGHFDHVADVVKIAQRCGSTVIANFEICEWLTKQGVEKTQPMNLGGSISQPFGRVKMTLAHHSSTLPDGTPAGNPAGFLLSMAEKTVYFACDTALFYDMKLICPQGIDLAILPIGDLFTMGPEDSLEAIRLLTPRRVAPAHYNTWPPIQQDASKWAEQVREQTGAEPIVLTPGESISL